MLIRIGECNKCGKCCIAAGCEFYKEGKCTIYKNRPESCKNYPSIQNFKDGWLIKGCGFKFIEDGN